MDVSLSDSEVMLRETAQRLAVDLACRSVQELETWDGGPAWKTLQNAGFIGLRLPAAFGGGEGTTLDLALVVEAMARGPVPVPLLGSALAIELLYAAGASPELLERASTGDLRCTVALSPDLDQVAATEAGEVVGFDTEGAGLLLMFDSSGRRLRAVQAPPPKRGTDLTRNFTRADASNVVDLAGLGDELQAESLNRLRARSLALVSADLLGIMEGALEQTVSYASGRIQFGVPIGSFQALQHLAADQLVSLEGARSLTEYAAWAVDHLDDQTALAAAVAAKGYSSRAARNLCEAAIQIHGGMGITWDCMAHVHLKRALFDARLFGDHNQQIVDLTALRQRRSA